MAACWRAYNNSEEDNLMHLGNHPTLVVCHPDFAKSFGKDLSIKHMAEAEVVQTVGAETNWIKMSKLYELNLKMPANWIKADSSLIT